MWLAAVLIAVALLELTLCLGGILLVGLEACTADQKTRRWVLAPF